MLKKFFRLGDLPPGVSRPGPQLARTACGPSSRSSPSAASSSRALQQATVPWRSGGRGLGPWLSVGLGQGADEGGAAGMARMASKATVPAARS